MNTPNPSEARGLTIRQALQVFVDKYDRAQPADPHEIGLLHRHFAEARAALANDRPTSTPPDAWQPIETAPKDGTHFVARGYTDDGKGTRKQRVTWYGKASHIGWHGWCWGRDVENVCTWFPYEWRPK